MFAHQRIIDTCLVMLITALSLICIEGITHHDAPIYWFGLGCAAILWVAHLYSLFAEITKTFNKENSNV